MKCSVCMQIKLYCRSCQEDQLEISGGRYKVGMQRIRIDSIMLKSYVHHIA